ncbi:MAG: hypothetical protein A3F72_03885 [Bacteroidetes bacterium RIFCSPLOWO2_12_FULL_35_15]|nr:MAG: hypothetical protein A3F72_03885 [Bacteroidetes bacterium RIFCSPLOWO2_12_FULL_35_15]
MYLFLTILFSFTTFNLSESENYSKTELSNQLSNDWKIEYVDNEIKIESSKLIILDKTNGTNQERIVFKYTNLTFKKLTLSFARTLYYDGKCYGCDNQEKRFEILLNPSETKSYDDLTKDKLYFIFSKDLNNTIKKTLDSFQILKIEKHFNEIK